MYLNSKREKWSLAPVSASAFLPLAPGRGSGSDTEEGGLDEDMKGKGAEESGLQMDLRRLARSSVDANAG
jgi:hypothetical protein